ncbi:MAG: SRPBCC family protein [Acidimicrobiales bacterium]
MPRSPYVIEYSSRYDFDLPPREMWDAVEQPERFEAWWGWLREFRLEGGGLVDGAVLHGLVSPPVPYQMRIEVHLEHCQAPRRIDAVVTGDLRGTASLVLEPHDEGTRAEVAWTIEMMQRPMRLAARVAYPLLRWGHDRVVDATVAGFRRHLQAGAGR